MNGTLWSHEWEIELLQRLQRLQIKLLNNRKNIMINNIIVVKVTT